MFAPSGLRIVNAPYERILTNHRDVIEEDVVSNIENVIYFEESNIYQASITPATFYYRLHYDFKSQKLAVRGANLYSCCFCFNTSFTSLFVV